MKGIVFTEFMDMVGKTFSDEVLENILDRADLDSGGAYTAIGTYNNQEIVNLVVELSKETDIPIPDLLKAYGEYLFTRFTELFPQYFEPIDNSFEFLEQVDNHIHVEVKKLYPDAELPRFSSVRNSEDTLTMNYYSSRHFEDLAYGLIKGCNDFYKESVDVQYKEGKDESGESCIVFTLKKYK